MIPKLDTFKMAIDVLDEKNMTLTSWKIKEFQLNLLGLITFYPIQNKPAGTFLTAFFEYDFNEYESFTRFVDDFGLSSIYDLSNTLKTNIDNNSLHGRTKDAQHESLIKNIYTESKDMLIKEQRFFNEMVYYCLDAEGPEWSIGLKPMQRYYVVYRRIHPNHNKLLRYGSEEYLSIKKYLDIENIKIPSLPLDKGTELEFRYAQQIRNTEVKFAQKTSTSHISGVCYIDFMLLLENNILIRKCDNCHKYFIHTKRADEKYCDRVVSGTVKTCKEVGPMLKYTKKTDIDPLVEAYRKAYKSKHAKIKPRVKVGHTKEWFYKWKLEAEKKMELVRCGEISIDDFKIWAKSDFKNKSEGGRI